MNHQLSLDVQETTNEMVLIVLDSSVYDNILPVECQTLEVTLPGAMSPKSFEINELGTKITLTYADFHEGEDCALPDGIYILKYSISPNDKVYVEYNHMRTTLLLNQYKRAFCSVDLTSATPDKETQKKLDLLREIKDFIDASKIQVEICLNPEKGIALYAYAKKLLERFICKAY